MTSSASSRELLEPGMDDNEPTNILIVDDLPEKLLVYHSILEDLGENLVAVRSGPEALKQVLKNDFAVILLDVNMPDMDGFETASLIRQRKRSAHTPIIFLTAFADEVRTAQGYATGGVDYLPTPVVPDVLRAKVRVFIDLFKLRKQVARQAEEQAKRAAAEESARRSTFVAEASRALTSSLDITTTVRQLLGVVVPTLADLAAVTQAGASGHPWSTEMARLAGGQLEYTSLDDHDAPQDRLRDCHDEVLQTGKRQILADLEVLAPHEADGEALHLRWAAVLPLIARGRTLGALTLARSKAEAALSETDMELAEDIAGRAAIALDNALLVRDIQDNDRRRNEFLAMLAHELRNPLAPIRNSLEILRLVGIDQPELNAAREVIQRQLTHLVRLVDDLLDVSRITRGKIQLRPELTSIAEVVSTAVETSRPLMLAHGHRLDVHLPDGPLYVHADGARLAQVFANLLNNAAKYTPDGGEVSIVVARQGEEVVVRVSDTGAGIPRDMLAKVFDLFTQVDHSLDRSHGGLGIGLTLVRRLVEMHNGTVSAHSDGDGCGSEFVVRLPVAYASEALNNSEVPVLESEPISRFKVLVVDDNCDAATTLAMLLEARQHEVQVANDGFAALDAAVSFQPDVVLLDIGLPGIDGFEVARRLRLLPQTKDVLVVAVSGYGQDEDRQKSRQAGFDYHLVKPVDPALLQSIFGSIAPLGATRV
jgi:signal transduction histidine kinase/DNA-binding response OmpR family regulator